MTGASSGRLCRLVAAQIGLVIGPVGAEISREPQVPSRFLRLPGLLQGAPQAEVREVVHGRALDHCRELLARGVVAAGVKVSPAERLADRGLVGLVGARLLERDGRGREVAALEQVAAAAKEVVHVLAALLGGALVVPQAGLTSSDPGVYQRRSASIRSTMTRATSSLGARA